jgi:hypothetical protein
MQRIHIVIDKQGAVVIRSSGFTGPACLLATRPFEAALGVSQSSEPTEEMTQEVSSPLVAEADSGGRA